MNNSRRDRDTSGYEPTSSEDDRVYADDPFEDEEFEEFDRDSDFASMYTEVAEDEDDLADNGDEELVFEPSEESLQADHYSREEDGFPDDADLNEAGEAPAGTPLPRFTGTDNPLDEEWEENEFLPEDEEAATGLPLGLILVGVIALILLGAGGYGVVQQRTAMQDQIRNLQGALAEAESRLQAPRERTVSEEMALRNRELSQQVEQLTRENRSLDAIVAGLEQQLQAQQEALNASPATPKATPTPETPAKRPELAEPAPETTATASVTPGWFVNFGSYSRRAVADSWAGRLQPEAGDVVVTTGSKDGKTFYRVRVVNLTSKDSADATARSLAQQHGLPPLWVGREG